MMSAHNNPGNDATSVFSDFCQAWGARFPGSELPDAWEEDVRANLKKHKTKVAILKDELDKEQMYVEYLQTLLKDIERKKKQRHSGTSATGNGSVHKIPEQHLDASKQEFLDSHLSDLKKNDAFVTVINVSSASSADAPSSVPPPLPPPTTATNSNYKSSDDNQSSGNQNSGGQKKIALSNSEKSASLPLASSKRANKKPAILPTGSKI